MSKEIIKCYKVKNGKMTKIPVDVCLSKKKIDTFLDKGYVISKVTEVKTKDGSKTKIETFSPRTYEEAWEEHRRRWGPGIPF
jgi:hypothetical protein